MDTKLFISRVVPDDGTYFLATSYIKNDGKTGARHTTLENIDAIKPTVNKFIARKRDIYFAVGSYVDNKNRKRSNAKSKKCLYLDLDWGSSKGYPDSKAALAALYGFIKDTGLPPASLMVGSGNGIHVYWTFEKAIPISEWVPLATALKEKCIAYGLDIDHQCTADISRILRVPGTANYKDPAHPKRVRVIGPDHGDYPIARLAKSLLVGGTPALTAVGTSTGVLPAGQGHSIPGAEVDAADTGTEREYASSDTKSVIDRCPTLRHSFETNGKDDSEGMWNKILHVLAYTSDGRDYIHQIGSAHPTYTHADTENRFQTKLDAGTSGPVSCNTLAMEPGNKCSECPLYGKVKNPVLAARYRPPGDLPAKYVLQDNGIFEMVEDETGTPLLAFVTEKRFYNGILNTVNDDGEEKVFLRCDYNIGNTTPKTIEVPLSAMATTQAFATFMAKTNIPLKPNEARPVLQLMGEWKSKMEAAKHTCRLSKRLGWTRVAGNNAFVLGDKILLPGGDEMPNILGQPIITAHYTPHGKLESWKKAADTILQNQHIEIHIALASAFAAPLMKLAGIPGAVLSIVSQQSGIGKTKALETAQSVWGHKNQMFAINDTANSINTKISVLNNLPAYWDELGLTLRGAEGKDFANHIFRMAQGKEKQRLDVNSNLREAHEWNTLITIASNDSVQDTLELHSTNDATIKRVLELSVDCSADVDVMTPGGSTDLIFSALDRNHGTAGEIYARFLLDHHDQLQDSIQKVKDSIAKNGYAQDERIRIAAIAALVVGAKAAKVAGLVGFDIKAILDRLVRVLDREADSGDNSVMVNGTARYTNVQTPQQKLREYIEEHAGHVNKSEDFRVKGGGNQHQPTITLATPQLLPVRVHIADKPGLVRVKLKHFRDWLTANYGAGARDIKELKNAGFVDRRAGLDAGLPGETNAKDRLLEGPIP